MGLTLNLSVIMAVMSAIQFGWNLGVTNLPENYIKCWMETANFNQNLTKERFSRLGGFAIHELK